VDPKKQEAVRKWPVPENVEQLQCFLGFTNYHRDHIPNYAGMSACLYELLHKKKSYDWQIEHQAAFEQIKESILSAPCLSYPSPNGPFILDTDASDKAIGAVLSQVQNGETKVICFASHILLRAQKKYCTTRKELLAVVKFCRFFRHYLLGRPFTVRTDHGSLVWLMRFKHLEGQLARWMEELSQYDMQIVHRPGRKHLNADGLSRIPDTLPNCNCYEAGKSLDSLPCGGCSYCARAHNQWSRFMEDVDDIVPLAVRVVTDDTNHTSPNLTPPGGFSFPISHSSQGEDDTIEIDQESGENQSFCETNWLATYTPGELREKQLLDSDLKPLITYLETKNVPKQFKLFLSSPASKALWLCRKQLVLKSGVLYYRWENPVEAHLRLVVPSSLKQEVLFFCHDAKSAGHLGQTKTLLRLKQSFLWHNMAQDCRLYVASCSVCNKNKKQCVKPKASLRSYHAGFPMERVHLDILGPFNISDQGNSYVLMLIDQFTKWVEMAAIPDQTAETVAKKFLTHFIVTFGCPLEVHTDQGRNFESSLFKTFCELFQITKTRTTPYRPSSNGQIERYNRIVLQMIRCYIEGKHSAWDRDLPLLSMALHSMENRQTGFTPNRMMLGRETIQPVDLLLGTFDVNSELYEPHQWVKYLGHTLNQVHRLARENLQSAQLRQKRDYDLRIQEKMYQVGDVVYQLDSSTKVGKSSKLQSIWKGPFLVIKTRGPIYTIQNNKKILVVHHDRLKPCQDRVFPLWLKRLRHEILSLGEGGEAEEIFESEVGEIHDAEEIPEDVHISEDDLDPAGIQDSTKDETIAESTVSGNDVVEAFTGEELKSLFDRSEVEEVSPQMTKTRIGRKIRLPYYLSDYDINH
jgi:transposase InsO family protein